MLKPPFVVGSAKMSRVVNGALLSQKKLYIACLMSETAQAGMGVDVAVYHRVEVSNPFMMRVS